jgi:hypothetical protein
MFSRFDVIFDDDGLLSKWTEQRHHLIFVT